MQPLYHSLLPEQYRDYLTTMFVTAVVCLAVVTILVTRIGRS
jgi:hypothetical protein